MKTPRFGRILLATDGSPEATAAVYATLGLAKATAACVDVVHVWNLEAHVRDGVWAVETLSEAKNLLEGTISRLKASGIPVKGEILRADRGHIAPAIAEEARQRKADLVIVGSRGLSDWQSIFKHSVSHQLLCALDSPLLMVHAKADPSTAAPRRILAAVAGGDDVAPAMRAAIAAASEPETEVLVVHVAQNFAGAQGFAYVEPEREIHATLEQATGLLKDAGIACEGMVAHAGPVGDVVAQIAAEWRADLIVIGSSRMGDVGSILFGSVTHVLLRGSKRPLLVAERTPK